MSKEIQICCNNLQRPERDLFQILMFSVTVAEHSQKLILTIPANVIFCSTATPKIHEACIHNYD